MLLQDTIGEHLLEVDKAAREQEEVILKQLEEKEPLPDKEADQMAWVRAANQHRAIVVEFTILTVLIEAGTFFFILFLIAIPKKHERQVFTCHHKV